MDLIVKSTERCNFKCTFCSSTDIIEGSDRDMTLPLFYIQRFLKRNPDTSTIILNGGDPLMVDPEYYWALIEHLDANDYKASISFTTNLWPFYKNPDKWAPLFKHPRVGVTTSFQYGDGRRITKNRVYTELDFWNVSDAFLEHVGYRPGFISVIDDSNIEHCLRTVELAKRMNVECKLNHAMASGDQSAPMVLSKMYEVYCDIYEAGLWQWEYNTKQLMNRLSSGNTTCPLSRDCSQGIRAFNPDGSYYSCGSFADDKEYPIHFDSEMLGVKSHPIELDPQIQSMHDGCWGCSLFQICNGCRKTIKDHKRHGKVQEHCARMKTLESRILSISTIENASRTLQIDL